MVGLICTYGICGKSTPPFEVDRVEHDKEFVLHLGHWGLQSTVAVFCQPNESGDAAERLIYKFNAEHIILVGSAVPLVPYLQKGDIVLSEEILRLDETHDICTSAELNSEFPDRPIKTDAQLVERIRQTFSTDYSGKSNRPELISGLILSCNRPITDRRQIASIHRELGAVAISRESAALARICKQNDIRFNSIHVVIDTIDDRQISKRDKAMEQSCDILETLIGSVFTEMEPEPSI